jgi:hypothetical protein
MVCYPAQRRHAAMVVLAVAAVAAAALLFLPSNGSRQHQWDSDSADGMARRHRTQDDIVIIEALEPQQATTAPPGSRSDAGARGSLAPDATPPVGRSRSARKKFRVPSVDADAHGNASADMDRTPSAAARAAAATGTAKHHEVGRNTASIDDEHPTLVCSLPHAACADRLEAALGRDSYVWISAHDKVGARSPDGWGWQGSAWR